MTKSNRRELDESKLDERFFQIYCEAVDMWKKANGESLDDIDYYEVTDAFKESDFGKQFKDWAENAYDAIY